MLWGMHSMDGCVQGVGGLLRLGEGHCKILSADEHTIERFTSEASVQLSGYPEAAFFEQHSEEEFPGVEDVSCIKKQPGVPEADVYSRKTAENTFHQCLNIRLPDEIYYLKVVIGSVLVLFVPLHRQSDKEALTVRLRAAGGAK